MDRLEEEKGFLKKKLGSNLEASSSKESNPLSLNCISIIAVNNLLIDPIL
jgi:hypothetical protein